MGCKKLTYKEEEVQGTFLKIWRGGLEKKRYHEKKRVNYYSGGMLMPGRTYNSQDYEYGYNGKRKDDEIKGSGNSYDFGSRMYDTRLNRWMSIDPLFKIQPEQSPYKAMMNNPISFIDVDGNIGIIVTKTINRQTGKTKIKIEKVSDLVTDGKRRTETVLGGRYTAVFVDFFDFTIEKEITIDENGKRTERIVRKTIHTENGSKGSRQQDFLFGIFNDERGDMIDDPNNVSGGLILVADVGQDGELTKVLNADGQVVDISQLFGGRGGGSVSGQLGKLLNLITTSFGVGGVAGDGINALNKLLNPNQAAIDVFQSVSFDPKDKVQKITKRPQAGGRRYRN